MADLGPGGAKAASDLSTHWTKFQRDIKQEMQTFFGQQRAEMQALKGTIFNAEEQLAIMTDEISDQRKALEQTQKGDIQDTKIRQDISDAQVFTTRSRAQRRHRADEIHIEEETRLDTEEAGRVGSRARAMYKGYRLQGGRQRDQKRSQRCSNRSGSKTGHAVGQVRETRRSRPRQ